jgi:hypothetical protein
VEEAIAVLATAVVKQAKDKEMVGLLLDLAQSNGEAAPFTRSGINHYLDHARKPLMERLEAVLIEKIKNSPEYLKIGLP